MNILFECVNSGAKVFEVSIDFKDREKGKSKLGLSDILEFMMNSFILRWKVIKKTFQKHIS